MFHAVSSKNNVSGGVAQNERIPSVFAIAKRGQNGDQANDTECSYFGRSLHCRLFGGDINPYLVGIPY